MLRVSSPDCHLTYDVTVMRTTGSPLLAFSTLGCPEWTALEVVDRAAAMGFAGIEWRGGADGHAGTHLPVPERRRSGRRWTRTAWSPWR